MDSWFGGCDKFSVTGFLPSYLENRKKKRRKRGGALPTCFCCVFLRPGTVLLHLTYLLLAAIVTVASEGFTPVVPPVHAVHCGQGLYCVADILTGLCVLHSLPGFQHRRGRGQSRGLPPCSPGSQQLLVSMSSQRAFHLDPSSH